VKVVAFNGSPREDGNTATLIQHVLKILQIEGIETEFIQLGGQLIHGCTACGTCMKMQNKECKITNDNVNLYIKKIALRQTV
jgi:multimeric flavodoxin WrbA